MLFVECINVLYRDIINLSSYGMSQKKIHQILNKDDDNKLEALLTEEETISECKSSNPKLLAFLTTKENLAALIRYAT